MGSYKVLVSFAGAVCGTPGQTININDPAIAKDLLKAGYIKELEPVRDPAPAPAKTTKRRKKSIEE